MAEIQKQPITIVDYGMGNIGSLINMFRRIGAPTIVTSRREEIAAARKILLPGVGAFDAAMSRINELDLRDVLRERALSAKVPFFGICLGMQLLVDSSEEGTQAGLGLIAGETRRFPKDAKLKVPHMGWNEVTIVKQTELTECLPDRPRFYFVHSYFVHAEDRNDSMLRCNYGMEFDAGLNRENVFGAQFHPEKSHKFGMAMLTGFAGLPC